MLLGVQTRAPLYGPIVIGRNLGSVLIGLIASAYLFEPMDAIHVRKLMWFACHPARMELDVVRVTTKQGGRVAMDTVGGRSIVTRNLDGES